MKKIIFHRTWIVLATSLLMGFVTDALNRSPTADDELNSLMIQWHNDARTRVLNCKLEGQPPAKVMPNLTFDKDLAQKAQEWAEQCKVGHDKDTDRATSKYQKVGQNFAGNYDFKGGFDSWFGEHSGYNFDENKCSLQFCGHYTQVVWATTEQIGCGYQECDPKTTDFKFGKSIVCNYGSAGNLMNTKPYERGDQSKCSHTSTTMTTTTTTPTSTSTTSKTSSEKSTTGTSVASNTTETTDWGTRLTTTTLNVGCLAILNLVRLSL